DGNTLAATLIDNGHPLASTHVHAGTPPSMALPKRTHRVSAIAPKEDRHLLEWLLFMLVAILSFREAWIFADGNTHDFFWKAWDGLGYYQWLPTVFLSGNIDWMYWCFQISEDKAISLFTLGVAVLQLPFFLLAQWATWVFGYPSTGFNPANAVGMMAATATYAGAGAVLSFKLARRFSNTPAALLAVLVIYAGSN